MSADEGPFVKAFREFSEGIEEGYKKQSNSIKADKEKTEAGERLADGAASGVVDGLLNPIRWLSAILRI